MAAESERDSAMTQLTVRSIALGVLILLVARAIDSCSFNDRIVLEFEARPDAPIEKYIAGDLGLIRSSFARSHLVVAYRYLSGHPLTAVEQRGVADLMYDRLPAAYSRVQAPDTVWNGWVAARVEAVADAPAAPPSAPYFAQTRAYGSYINCTGDAFANAAVTLRKRVSQFGAGSTPVRAWLAAQDAVFGNCQGTADLPGPADASLPPIIHKDRDYQIASANFYRGQYELAHQQFSSIAADSESPWAPLSRYVAARALVRQSTIPIGTDDQSEQHLRHLSEPMRQAERDVRAILADPDMKFIHASARRTLNFIEIRLHPAEYAERVAGLVGRGQSPATIKNDLADYTTLLDDDLRPTDEMTRWIVAMQEGDGAFEEWQKNKSTLWLVPAIAHARSNDETASVLIDAARTVGSDSPAYVTVQFYRLRMLRNLHRDEEMLPELNELLSTRTTMGPSTRNALLALRLPFSASLDEFVRDAPREAPGYEMNEPLDQPAFYLGEDAAADINRRLRLDDLMAMARRPLPGKIPETMIVATWTRALLLGRQDVLEAMTPLLLRKHPQMAPAIERFKSAKPEDRRYEAVYILVQASDLTPYVGGANTREGEQEQRFNDYESWWCRDAKGLGNAFEPAAFTKEDRIASRASEERGVLLSGGSGSTYVLQGVVEWAKNRPHDPRVPEALSLAIHATRRACPDDRTRSAAKAAFNLLHAKYGKTKWAKETRYWYDGRN
jgi:hypothetical protein